MTDREAMKLALFALDIVKIHYTQSRHINEAIAALKERLAQPEQEPTPEIKYKMIVIDDLHPQGIPVEQWVNPPQRTEQEPVAWLSIDSIGERYLCFDKPLDNDPVKPLYTTPPQRTWVDLSDEDIEECFTITPDLYLKRHIAQRISDKLKEKNT